MSFAITAVDNTATIGLAMGASDSHHGHPYPYRNEVEEWSESETADVATRTE